MINIALKFDTGYSIDILRTMRENMTEVRVTYQEEVNVHIFGTVSLVLQNMEQKKK